LIRPLPPPHLHARQHRIPEGLRPGDATAAVSVHLITGSDQETLEKQVENLGQVQDSFAATSTPFTWEIDASPNFHARSITTDHGWKITLDRGLDLFQWFEFSPFNAAAVMQEARMVKGCEVTYIRQPEG
jgi:ATP-dependent Lon protease